MNSDIIVPIIVAIITAGIAGLVTYKQTTKNHNLESIKQKEAERSNTTTEWEGLYKVTAEERDELKKEMKENRILMDEMRKEINDIKSDMHNIHQVHAIEKNGYLIRIDQLEEENDELREENAMLKELRGDKQ